MDLYVSLYHHTKDAARRAKDLMQMAGFESVTVESKNLTFHYNGIPALRSELITYYCYYLRVVYSKTHCVGGRYLSIVH